MKHINRNITIGKEEQEKGGNIKMNICWPVLDDNLLCKDASDFSNP